jgi:hypothetical protein
MDEREEIPPAGTHDESLEQQRQKNGSGCRSDRAYFLGSKVNLSKGRTTRALSPPFFDFQNVLKTNAFEP